MIRLGTRASSSLVKVARSLLISSTSINSKSGLMGNYEEIIGGEKEVTRILFCGNQFPASHLYTREYLSKIPHIQVDDVPIDDVPSVIGNYHVCVPRMMRINLDVISRAKQLKLILQFGVGLEGVDVDAATKHGIKVARIPAQATGNAASCAEMAIYLMLGLLRMQKEMEISIKLKKLGEPAGGTLFGKTVFIMGLGSIGCELAKRLKPFDVRIIATKRSWTMNAENDCAAKLVDEKGSHDDIHKFAGMADIVVCCLNMNRETAGIVNHSFIKCMKKGAYLVNIARGGLLDYDAVVQSLESGHLGGLGIDVAWIEPFDPNDPILKYPNVIITPHVAGVTEHSYRSMAKTNTVQKKGARESRMASACHKWKPVIVILGVYFVMAVLNVLFKNVLDEGSNQLVIVTYRLIVGAMFLIPIAYFCERKSATKLTTPIVFNLFFSALMGATLTLYLFLIGIQYTSAAYSTAFVNMTPVFTFLLALPLRQEHVDLRTRSGIAKVSGSLICVGGVILLILYRGFPLNHSGMFSHQANNSNMAAKVDRPRNWILGSAFLVLSIVCWAAWFLIQARIGKKYPCKYTSTTLMSAFGAVQSAILCFAINRDLSLWILHGKLQIFTVLFAGIFGSGLCYVGISWCVKQRGPVFTAAFSPFIQIFVMMLDLAFFHEPIYFGSVIGSVLVVCGLYVLLWGKSNEAVANASKPPEATECNGIPAPLTVVIGDVTQASSNTRSM